MKHKTIYEVIKDVKLAIKHTDKKEEKRRLRRILENLKEFKNKKF